MKTKLLFVLTSLFIFFISKSFAQQPGAYLIQNGVGAGSSPSIIELSGNRTLVVGYSSFGYDSSYVTMIWLDKDMNVMKHKEFRLTLPLNFVFHAVKCPGGFLIGTLEYSTFGSPFSIIRTDTSGNILRYDLSFNNPNFQEKIKQLVANDNGSFTAYTSKSGTVDAMYRIEGNLADTIYRTKKITPAITNDYFRPFFTLDLNGNGKHLLTGTTNDFANGKNNAMLIKLDSGKIYWGKSYDYGQTGAEEADNIIQLVNGNYSFVGQTASIIYNDGVVTVIDTNGQNVWSKKLSIIGGGVYPSAIVQASNNDILVFGNNHGYQGVVLKFSQSGSLIWKKKFTATGSTYFGSAFRQPDNKIVVGGKAGNFLMMQLDENGEGCSLADDTSIHVTDVIPTVTDISFKYTPVTVSFTSQKVRPRNLNTTVTPICVSNSIREMNTEISSVTVFPNPAEDICYLSNLSSTEIKYSLHDLVGRKLLDGKFIGQTSFSLSDFPHGIYFIHFNMDGKEEVRKVVH